MRKNTDVTRHRHKAAVVAVAHPAYAVVDMPVETVEFLELLKDLLVQANGKLPRRTKH